MRLLKRSHYKRMGYSSKIYVGNWLILKIMPSKSLPPRLGITANRQFGKAHHRNRFKRLVKEAFRLSCHQFNLKIDLLVLPRSLAKEACFENVLNDLLKGMRDLGYLSTEENS